jgi:hypothetical protein
MNVSDKTYRLRTSAICELVFLWAVTIFWFIICLIGLSPAGHIAIWFRLFWAVVLIGPIYLFVYFSRLVWKIEVKADGMIAHSMFRNRFLHWSDLRSLEFSPAGILFRSCSIHYVGGKLEFLSRMTEQSQLITTIKRHLPDDRFYANWDEFRR